MANILDYLDWRGDLTLAERGFNEVDNLLMAELCFLDFSGIVPADFSAPEAMRAYDRLRPQETMGVLVPEQIPELGRKMAASRRFSDLTLCGYVSRIDEETQTQFSALTLLLPDKTAYIAFRGTDDTIVGWKEDFNMSFLTATPGQEESVQYLQKVARQTKLPLRLMGHSKGGNLAVYAAVNSDRKLQDRIDIIYSNDGPGFNYSMIDPGMYRNLTDRIRSIVPESSIVGMLFEHEEEYEVVKSSGSGAGQHDVMSWEVRGTTLVHLNHVDGKSVLVDKALKSWIGEMDEKQREVFVDTLFGILDEADIRTVDDLANMNYTKFMELMKAKSSLDKETQDTMRDTFLKLVQKSAQTVAEHLLNK